MSIKRITRQAVDEYLELSAPHLGTDEINGVKGVYELRAGQAQSFRGIGRTWREVYYRVTGEVPQPDRPDMAIRLEQYGERGWIFSITVGEDTTRYRTNQQGEGLWIYRQRDDAWYSDGTPIWDYQQIQGTAQFILPAERRRAYDAIRYEFRDKEAGE